MIEHRIRVLIGAAALFGLTAATVAAQSTREEWLALKQRKQARQALAAPATVSGPLAIVSVRFYSDAAGRLVGVGEVRNDSSRSLAYTRLEFAFYNNVGALVGAELTYVQGGFNRRIQDHQLYENVLGPGSRGFFKVWASIPAASMSSYTASSAGEDLATALPLLEVSGGQPTLVTPQRYAGDVLSDWLESGRSDPVSVAAYNIRVMVPARQAGALADVQSTLVDGVPFVTPCGESTAAAIVGGGEASYTGNLDRPANSLDSAAFEWDEMGVSQGIFVLRDGSGSPQSFTVVRECGWTASADVPWITIIEGARSDRNAGPVRFTVSPNVTGQTRSGRINVSGMVVTVTQQACDYAVSPQALFVGSAGGDLTRALQLTTNCFGTAETTASWLRVIPSTDPSPVLSFSLLVQPNFTGITRRTVVSLGSAAATVVQSAAGRNADLNRDGHVDLLWHHQTDGRISTWLMRGSQLLDGMLLNPGQVSETNWKLVGTADFNRDGSTDLVWQHSTDGRVSWWRMRGTTRIDGSLLSPPQVADTNWKIRAVADFNADGTADLVWQHDGTGQIAVWFMRFDSPSLVLISGDPLGPGQVPDVNWKIVGSGDFNLDGWPDLVWQHQADGRIAVWKMRGRTLVDGALISPGQVGDLDWKIRGVGDINGDDMPDLIWQHATSGDVAVWLMNGTTLVSGFSLGQVPDTSWHIVGPR